MTIKLKSKTYKRYTGKVYDLSVENKSSYNVEGIPVHNSGAGSLVCYLLGITQVDPIKHGLLFERFLSKKKSGLPDIDCLEETMLVPTPNGVKYLKDISPGDEIINIFNQKEEVLFVKKRTSLETDDIFEVYIEIENCLGCIIATGKHRLFTIDNLFKEISALKEGDLIKSNYSNAKIIKIKRINNQMLNLVDVTTKSTKSFNVIPFNVLEKNGNLEVEKNYDL